MPSLSPALSLVIEYHFFNLVSEVRQGGVLSPSLFAIYVDDIAKKIISRGIGCHMSFISTGIFLYADDLFLIAASFPTPQIMLYVCKLNYLGSICALTFINPYTCILGSVSTYTVLI